MARRSATASWPGQIEESAFPDGLEPYQRVRAAAAEIGRTPTPILVPCHRVIGAAGSLTGYGGGLERKRALLELEGYEIVAPDPVPAPEPDQLALL
jgi:methylated-DNA-[protein]-cysteine S-methyltransferase